MPKKPLGIHWHGICFIAGMNTNENSYSIDPLHQLGTELIAFAHERLGLPNTTLKTLNDIPQELLAPKSREFQSLDYRHQAMATILCKCDARTSGHGDWEGWFRHLISNESSLSRDVRSLFAILLIGLNFYGGDPLLFHSLYWRIAADLHRMPTRPLSFNADSFLKHSNNVYTTHLPRQLTNAILADNPAVFEICRATTGKALSKSLVKLLFHHHALKITLQNLSDIERHIAPADILFACVSFLPSNFIVLIDELESRHPGLVRTARDLYSNNALWYGLHRFGENRCAPEVEKRLIELGCDPESPNLLDLSYASMLKAKDIFKTI